MTAVAVRLQGVELQATRAGALIWPAAATVVVADLHLEKGSSRGGQGVLLPPYDTRATLAALADTIAGFRPRRVICLGDSFHDSAAAERLDAADRALLLRLTAAAEWIWVAGNHDPRPSPAVGGRSEAEVRLGPLTFRHRADDRPTPGEVSGHFHPKASVSIAGRRIAGRCFVSDGQRLILPASGAYAGGLDVLDDAITSLMAPQFTVYLLGHRRIHAIASQRLRR
jgi:DNA ligase-associated metallophosphoesterase